MIPLSRPQIGREEHEAVGRVLDSGWLAAGPEVAALEAEFAEYTGVPEAAAVSSGTTALWLALWAAGIGPGDEVIVPSFTFIATAGAVAQTGARPVYADIEPGSYCITADTVRPHIGPRTVAVVPVHLYGHPAPITELVELCDSRGLLLVEDAAQAHGARWNGKRVGGIGDVGVFSFYPTKNMTSGEGGMVTTRDTGIAERVRSLRNHGLDESRRSILLGTNARMTEIAGAMGRVQLRNLDVRLARRRANAEWLNAHLSGIVGIPQVDAEAEHAWGQYTIRCGDRARLTAHLDGAGVGWAIYYATGCHRHPAIGIPAADLPETERACAEVVSLPVRPDLTDGELAAVAAAVEVGSS